MFQIFKEEFLDNICVLISGVAPGQTYKVEVHEHRTGDQNKSVRNIESILQKTGKQIKRSERIGMTIPKTPPSPLEETYQRNLKASNDEYPISYAITVRKTEPATRKISKFSSIFQKRNLFSVGMAKLAEKFRSDISTHDKTLLLSAETQKDTSTISSQTSLRREDDQPIEQRKARTMDLLARLEYQIKAREYSRTNGYSYSRRSDNSNYLDV
jgi:hypothetical protein